MDSTYQDAQYQSAHGGTVSTSFTLDEQGSGP